MKNSNWNYPTSIWFGQGRITELATACDQLNIKNPLFVTDEGLLNLDIVKNTCQILKDAAINFSVYAEVQGNPTGKNVAGEIGRASCRERV